MQPKEDATGTPGSGDQRELQFWALPDTFYIRPILQHWEIQVIYLIQRNNHIMSGKMRRQRNTFQMKTQDKPFIKSK